jgi:hypothetical protein
MELATQGARPVRAGSVREPQRGSEQGAMQSAGTSESTDRGPVNRGRGGAVTRSASKLVRCGAPTVRGGICTAPGTMPDRRCPHHSTTVSAKTKRTWQERGRKNAMKSRGPISLTAADLSSAGKARALVEETLDLVRRGRMPTSVGNVVYKLVSVGLKANEQKLAEQLIAESDQ